MKGLVVGVLLLVASVYASQERGKNMLVLLDDLSMENSYSVFLGSLKDRGYSLHIQKADSDAIKFKEIGAFKYDSLLLFAPATEEFGGSATVENILEFIDEGHDVILAASGDAAEPTREIAAAVGVDLGSEGSYLIDHLNFDASDYDGEHTLVIANGFVDSPMILGKKKLNSVLFRGTAASLNPSNQLVFSVLSGSSSSYCLRPEGKIASTNDVHVAGTRSALVAGLQARNNARVAVSGSLELFSDAFINQKVKKSADDAGSASGNLQFITELSKWVLHERGLIRAIDIAYYHPDGREQTFFTVEDTITYTVTLQEWDGEKWIPFTADDVLIELDMLDPYIRTNVKHVKNGRYEVTFQVPDVYGVFNFNLDYYRVGYTSIHDRRICTVRPRRHDQYERFIKSAYPYYAGAFSMFIGAFLLSLVFLLHREK